MEQVDFLAFQVATAPSNYHLMITFVLVCIGAYSCMDT